MKIRATSTSALQLPIAAVRWKRTTARLGKRVENVLANIPGGSIHDHQLSAFNLLSFRPHQLQRFLLRYVETLGGAIAKSRAETSIRKIKNSTESGTPARLAAGGLFRLLCRLRYRRLHLRWIFSSSPGKTAPEKDVKFLFPE